MKYEVKRAHLRPVIFFVAITISWFSGLFCMSVLIAPHEHSALGSFKTDTLDVTNTMTLGSASSPPALFSALRAASTDGNNLCVGGGCQSVAYDGVTSQTGSTLTAFGIGAMESATNAYDSVAIGYNALASNIDGKEDIAIGAGAAQHTVGKYAPDPPDEGVNIIAIGYHALFSNINGEQSIAIGDFALSSQINQRNSIAIGLNALKNTTADDDIGIGTDALINNVTGTQNIAIGVTMVANVSGSNNISLGHDGLGACTSCNNNVAIGIDVLDSNDSIQNVGIGTFALKSCTGYDDIGVGVGAGENVTSGHDNTFVGVEGGRGITTGSMNTIVGANSHGLPTGTTSKIILSDGDNTVADYLWLDVNAPTSVDHGALGTGSSNTVGNVTTIGSNTSVVLTYSNSGFPNRSWCQATLNANTISEHIVVTNSATAPTFSCFNTTTGAAANCDDFTYWCTGQ